MEKQYKFFEHKQCEYYPCHDMKEINCLFCYCPLMAVDCSEVGTPKYITLVGGVRVKDCSDCIYPHKRENYEDIMKRLRDLVCTEHPVKLDPVLKEKEVD